MRPIFIQIPRVAGKAIKDLILENYGVRGVLTDDSPSTWERLRRNPYEFNRFEAIAGSIPFFCFENFVDCECLFFTLVRDPVHRRVSDYCEVKRDSSHPLHTKVKDKGFTEFLALDLEQDKNTQCFFLGSQTRKFVEVRKIVQHQSNLLVRPFFCADKLMTEVGRRMEWDISGFEWDSESENGARPPITSSDRNKVLKMDAEDAKLYEWAQESFS